MRRVRRIVISLVVAVSAVGGVVATAPPAAAHGVDGVEATNYETRILAIEPATAGLEVRPVDLGEQLELRSTLDVDVTVLGYFGEPYLRVGPDGTFENRASPTWEMNRNPDAVGSPETLDAPESDDTAPSDDDGPDADMDVDWVRTGSGDTLRWHDHRAHWMSDVDPESVRDAPDSFHTVSAFELTLLVGTDEVVVRGEIVWVPPPSSWPFLFASLLLAVGLVVASRTRHWRYVLAAALAVLVISEIVHLLGAWGSTTATVASQLAASAYSVAAVILLAGALAWLLRARDPHDATPLVMVAGLVTLIAGGLADVSVLNHSQLATDLVRWLARATVVLALGLGAGLTIAAGLHVRRPREPRRQA